jgi:hypothetical protein
MVESEVRIVSGYWFESSFFHQGYVIGSHTSLSIRQGAAHGQSCERLIQTE